MKVLVIGAGPGGYVAALRAARLGAEVMVVESDEVGGTCLNWGCIPTKALLASADLFARMKRCEDYGLELSGDIRARLDRMMARKDKIVAIQAKGIRSLFKSSGISLVEGRARLISPREVEVSVSGGERRQMEGDALIVATGSRPAAVPGLPYDGNRVISSNEALHLKEVPARLIIIGAGVIGCEFAFIFRELGCEVTLVEAMTRAVSTEDHEISEILERELKKKKIRLLKGTKTTGLDVAENVVTVSLEAGDGLEAEQVLVSVGRAPNTEGLGLEAVGVRLGGRGEVAVDDRLRTNVDSVYAVGDVTGGMMLAHVASKQGMVAVENIMGRETRMNYDVVPAAIFTHPEIGSVGLREHQCVERQMDTRIGRFPFRGLGKAHAMGEIAGMVKVIADAATDRILGVHIIGPHASDLVHEAALAMEKGLTARDVAEMIHAHPTLAEGLMEACEDVHDQAIHLPKK